MAQPTRTFAVAGCSLLIALVAYAPPVTATGPQPVGRMAPYQYLGWGNPQAPAAVTAATGVRNFTMAFMLNKGKCNPLWDGRRPLLGGVDAANIDAVRANGGDIVVSFGGWSGSKLGVACKTPASLAAAYQKVIDAYGLRAIDIDVERTEFNGKAPRQRVVDALAIVAAANPGLETYITIGTDTTGPSTRGQSMIQYAASKGFLPTAWTVMPFDFGVPVADMAAVSVSAATGLANTIANAYGISTATAFQHSGISTMNGLTDDVGATVSLSDFTTIRAFADANHLGRLTFWSLNRDRACAGSTATAGSNCSGVAQTDYEFTNIFAGFVG